MSKLPTIYGFNKHSEMGVDIFSPSIFLGGCNLRCPYCINCKLVNCNDLSPVKIEEVEKYVRENNCKWVNISGGEPTCCEEEALICLIETIKGWGCKVGMATNGVNTDVLMNILNRLNYVALDIKTSSYKQYQNISADKKSVVANVFASKAILSSEKAERDSFDYEVRTTLFPPFIKNETLMSIGSFINKDDKWVLQKFRNNSTMLDSECKFVVPYDELIVDKFLEIAKCSSDNVFLRNI